MFNSEHILQTGGLIAVGLMIFAESGLFFGIIFPGDTLLLTAGFFAGAGKLSLFWLVVIATVAAVLGDNVGYHIGRRLGPRVFKRQDGLFFRQEYIERTQKFYEKHGGITIVLARFIAYVRTFAPTIAGVGKMEWPVFAFFNVIGAILWVVGLSLVGYVFGASFPASDKYFIWALFIGAQILLVIVLWKIFKNPDTRRKLKRGLKEEIDHLFKRK